MSDNGSDDELETAPGDVAFTPFHLAISKPALRAYLNTILVVLAGLALLGLAIVAYISFYYSYVPTRSFRRPIYLEFGSAHHPHGFASLSQELVSNQHYDVKVILHMPRTPTNTGAGNFMLDLQLLAPVDTVSPLKREVLRHERRPAILTYHSRELELVTKAAALPLYIAGLRQESEELNIKIMEGVEFARGWRHIPTGVRLELQSEEKLHFYDVHIVFTAQLHGLRYLMYNYRILSFIVLTGMFWAMEMAVAGIFWLTLSLLVFPESGPSTDKKNEDEPVRIKKEEDEQSDMSDTPHTFPTLSGQPPLRYSSPHVKEENTPAPPDNEVAVGEADDEDDDFVLDPTGAMRTQVSDSGIGTSMESSSGRPENVRRRSRQSGRGQQR
ncbi:26S protease regulatory subunit 8 [Venturia nashicola]|uniref:26S protease regulatory subunit 8 n=1 Tax=Venturia nashicola TaxID=86259 RepID=A0A4Z1PAF3_9PEZI|nr:26S protease regulatory subunit 8 [Venturia nashicola]TLD37449.1 26S protease regulatory subunit 8 [Venturia nashicola]